jgi:hypothetical protein
VVFGAFDWGGSPGPGPQGGAQKDHQALNASKRCEAIHLDRDHAPAAVNLANKAHSIKPSMLAILS